MATNPTLLAMPLAENGTKNVIPATQATAGDGLFSQSTGFPAETSLPLGAGGVAPSREDFNGMANLLGGVAFMAQKGFTFNYDATQDYYVGCVVIDPNDGNRYLCIADMAAGTVAPSADTSNTYWVFYQVGGVNTSTRITTSGTYTAPVTGWYRITAKGGGGGGEGGAHNSQYGRAGAGGGEGGTTISYEKLTAGQTATIVIGAGGSGGAATGNVLSLNPGSDGGNTSVVVNGKTLTASGGKGGGTSAGYDGYGGHGGSGDTQYGAPGGNSFPYATQTCAGAVGGGNGGGASGSNARNGGGGGGGSGFPNASASSGGAGGDGYVLFEYFA